MKKILLALGLAFVTNVYSQQYLVYPNKDFVKSYTDPLTLNPIQSFPKAIDLVNNVVYQAGSKIISSTDENMLLIKYDSTGAKLWDVTYDYAGKIDRANAVGIDGSGNIYIAGVSENTINTNAQDWCIIKYNSSGTLQWTTRYNPGAGNDAPTAIAIDASSGDVYVAGWSTINAQGNNYIVIKYNTSGTQQWVYSKNGSASSGDRATKIVLSGSSVFVTGYVTNTGVGKDIYTACLNASTGALTWSTTKNGTASGDDIGWDLKKDGNGDVMITGQVKQTTTNLDFYVARLAKASGTVNFSNTYDGSHSNGDDIAKSIVCDGLGNYAITGQVTNGSNYDYNSIMYNSSGTQQWINSYSTNGTSADCFPSIARDTIYNYFYVCGSTYNSTNGNYDAVLYSVAPNNGVVSWTETHNGINNFNDQVTDMVLDGIGRIWLSAICETTTNVRNLNLIRYSQTPSYWPPDYTQDSSSLSYQYFQNQGQLLSFSLTAIPNVQYYTPSQNPKVFIETTKNYFVYTRGDTLVSTNDSIERIDIDFVNGNDMTKIYTSNPTEGYSNFFLSHLAAPITGVKGNKRLLVPNLWPGIDLHYYSSEFGIKYYFVVKQPWGNVSDIKLNFSGQLKDTIINHNLKLDNVINDLILNRPYVYQVDTSNTIITSGTGNWKNVSGDQYTIDSLYSNVPFWPIVIEVEINKATPSSACPSGVAWSTMFGRSIPNRIKVSSKTGRQYVIGATVDLLFPTQNALQTSYSSVNFKDAFFTQFDKNNVIEWSTYYGSLGSNSYKADDFATGVDFDDNANVYLCGYTYSDSIPTWKSSTGGAFFQSKMKAGIGTNNKSDMFILKLDSTGCKTLGHASWCSYMGGIKDEQAVDLEFYNDTFYVVGNGGTRDYGTPVNSTPYLYKAGAYNQDSIGACHIHKFSKNCVYNWGTFFNTTTKPDSTWISAIDVASGGYLNITGYSINNCVPTTTAGQSLTFGGKIDAFWAVLKDDKINYCKYLGSDAEDYGSDIVCNSGRKVYITGYSKDYSTKRFPIKYNSNEYADSTATGGWEAWLSKFDYTDGLLYWSTYFGRAGYDFGTALDVDSRDYVYMFGNHRYDSIKLPNPNASGMYVNSAVNECFIAAFSSQNTYGWGTYWGSNWFDNAQDIAAYKDKSIYITGQGYNNGAMPLCPGSTGGYYNATANTGDMWLAKLDINSLYIGVKELSTKKLSSSILIYPNPATNSINIKLPELKKNAKLEIYNMVGQLIYNVSITTELTEVNIGQYRDGLYVIKLYNDNEIYSGKFIKEN